MPSIHPTALVDPAAALAEDVTVGPYAIIEADVTVGAGCAIGSHSILRRYTTLGEQNVIDSHVVLGGLPQDLGFDPATETYLRIGDRNTFREGVTISRATAPSKATTVGSDTYWMAYAHAGHDATISDRVILTNNVMIAGHVRVGFGAILGGGAAAHQFCWVGERAMLQGNCSATQHVPPFCIHRHLNDIAGLNVVGIRRAKDISPEEGKQLKEAYALLYRKGLTTTAALAAMDARDDWGPAPKRFIEFVREVFIAEPPFRRGLCAPDR
jgi:UDP-N-acetylglucosamine acyltransferase